MDYRELLNKCKTQPGCIGTREQKEKDSQLKYRSWVKKSNEETNKKGEKKRK